MRRNKSKLKLVQQVESQICSIGRTEMLVDISETTHARRVAFGGDSLVRPEREAAHKRLKEFHDFLGLEFMDSKETEFAIVKKSWNVYFPHQVMSDAEEQDAFDHYARHHTPARYQHRLVKDPLGSNALLDGLRARWLKLSSAEQASWLPIDQWRMRPVEGDHLLAINGQPVPLDRKAREEMLRNSTKRQASGEAAKEGHITSMRYAAPRSNSTPVIRKRRVESLAGSQEQTIKEACQVWQGHIGLQAQLEQSRTKTTQSSSDELSMPVEKLGDLQSPRGQLHAAFHGLPEETPEKTESLLSRAAVAASSSEFGRAIKELIQRQDELDKELDKDTTLAADLTRKVDRARHAVELFIHQLPHPDAVNVANNIDAIRAPRGIERIRHAPDVDEVTLWFRTKGSCENKMIKLRKGKEAPSIVSLLSAVCFSRPSDMQPKENVLKGNEGVPMYIRNMTDVYNLQYPHWEAVEAFRKVLLVGILSFCQQGSILQGTLAIIKAVVFLLVYMHYKPHQGRYAAANSQFCQFTLIVTLLTVLVTTSESVDLPDFGFLQIDQMGWAVTVLTVFATGSHASSDILARCVWALSQMAQCVHLCVIVFGSSHNIRFHLGALSKATHHPERPGWQVHENMEETEDRPRNSKSASPGRSR